LAISDIHGHEAPSALAVTQMLDSLPVLVRVMLANSLDPDVNVAAGAMLGNLMHVADGRQSQTETERRRRITLFVRSGALLCCLEGLKNAAEAKNSKMALLSTFATMIAPAQSGFAGCEPFIMQRTQECFDADVRDAPTIVLNSMRGRQDLSIQTSGVLALTSLVSTSAPHNSQAGKACESRRQLAVAAGAAGVIRQAMCGGSGLFLQSCDKLLSHLEGAN